MPWAYCQVIMTCQYTNSQFYFEDNLGLDFSPEPYVHYYKNAWTPDYTAASINRLTLNIRTTWAGDYAAAALYW